MEMRWHGVPDCTWFELGKAHLQLTGSLFKHVVHDEFIDGASVGLLLGAYWAPYRSLQRLNLAVLASVKGDPLVLELLVGGSRIKVELGRIGGVVALERYLLVLTSYVKSLLGSKRILHAIDDDNAGALAAVDHAKFAVVEEVVLLQEYIANLLGNLQLQFLRHGHCTTEDEAVVHRISEVDFVSNHYLLHNKTLTESLGVVVLNVVRMASNLLGHVNLCSCAHS